MKLIITIDTEEDNWGEYRTNGQTLENIKRIPRLQDVFDRYGVIPTYLITYPVATDEESISILSGILKRDACEIGMHCHPWNTPPFEEELSARNSMLCNLPPDLQYKKMETLDRTIRENFGIDPKTFRAGRWGFNREVALNLHKLQYKVDTSITAYANWRNEHGPDFSSIPPEPFWMDTGNSGWGDLGIPLLEVPGTIGFLQENFALCALVWNTLDSKPLGGLRLKGLLNRANLLNRVVFSPEFADGAGMIRLAKVMKKRGSRFVNMFFHSTSLLPGLTTIVNNEADEEAFYRRIEDFLIFAEKAELTSIRLSQTLKMNQ